MRWCGSQQRVLWECWGNTTRNVVNSREMIASSVDREGAAERRCEAWRCVDCCSAVMLLCRVGLWPGLSPFSALYQSQSQSVGDFKTSNLVDGMK